MTEIQLKRTVKTLQEQLEQHRTQQELRKQQNILKETLRKETKKRSYVWSKEAPLIKILSLEGKTLQEIGDIYEVSRERIRQILKKYFPDLSKERRGRAVITAENKKKYLTSLYARTGRTTGRCQDDLSRARARWFTQKKNNAKYGKWEWLIVPSDITYPDVCPYLNLPIDWFAESRQDNSPSLDRIDSTKGYIPGNVMICSWRANRIKNDGTAEEHRRIYEFLEELERGYRP